MNLAPIQLHPTIPPNPYPTTTLRNFNNTIKPQTSIFRQDTNQFMQEISNFRV